MERSDRRRPTAGDVTYGDERASASALVAQHRLASGARGLEAGRLGTIEVRDTQIILGAPMLFNKNNIDQFDF